MQALYQKQGRSRQFSSKQERDAHIGDEIKQLERAAAVKRSSADDLRSQVQQLSSQLMDLSQVRSHIQLDAVLDLTQLCTSTSVGGLGSPAASRSVVLKKG